MKMLSFLEALIFMSKIFSYCCFLLQEVTCLAFHPREQILVSGANDLAVKMFDYSKTAVKRAMKTIFVSFFIFHFSEITRASALVSTLCNLFSLLFLPYFHSFKSEMARHFSDEA